MLGKGAATHRPRDHPRDVDHANSRHRPVACGKRLGIAIGYLDDFEQRQAIDGRRLGVCCPFVRRSDHTRDGIRVRDGVLEIECVPFRYCRGNRLFGLLGPEQPDRSLAMVRVIAM